VEFEIKSIFEKENLGFKKLIIKKTNSENVSTPKVGVLKDEFALKLRIKRSLKSLICLK